MKLNKKQITELLIQQKPFIFVDQAEIISDNEIIGKFNLTEKNKILAGHFPNFPILPGVIAVEIMLQTGLILVAYKNNLKHNEYETYLVKIKDITLQHHISPPVELTIKVSLSPYLTDNYYKIFGSLFDGNKRKCYGEVISYFKKKGEAPDDDQTSDIAVY
ncbi:MAG: beta-hydroxyacyl-ACP dehydratase [Bacteroidetes bacterium]|nr:beta-hydroxyacyl-ACP dehydratase [Bacteroidota bacterium]